MSDSELIRLLIVDEQSSIRQLCAAIGGRTQLRCAQADSIASAMAQMENEAAELMLADLQMDGGSGLRLLAEVKRRWPVTEVALMGSYGTQESAAEAARLGAYDVVGKPFRVEELQRVLERMAEKARLLRENERLRIRLLGDGSAPDGLAAPCTDLEELERRTILQVFEQVEGDKEKAQKLLGISRATLYRKIKRYGIESRPPRRKDAAGERGAEDGQRVAGASQG
jgi:DNA-binding NtrC family response regulator